jgi:hypothetical protein
MQEEFDNKFGQRIRDVFENRQVSYRADDWDKLLAKKSERKRRFIILPVHKWAVIFILFLLLGGTGGLFLYNSFQNPGSEIELDQNEIIGRSDSDEELRKNIEVGGDQDTLQNQNEDNFPKLQNRFNENEELITNTNQPEKTPPNVTSEKNDKNTPNIVPEQFSDNQFLREKEKLVSNEKTILEEDSLAVNTDKSELLVKVDRLKDSIAQDLNSENFKADDELADLEAIDSLSNKLADLAAEETQETKRKSKAPTFGLVLAPVVNYDQADQNTDVHVGGGVLVEIPVSKNFDIYTGLLVANQRVNIQDNTLQELSSGTQLKSKNAILTGLDIPLNVKYNFEMYKNKMFIAVGFSSMTYFKENVESTYQVSSTVFSEASNTFGDVVLVATTTNVLETEIESKGTFNKFHFGKIINFSYGIEIPLKNHRQSIILEPYYKYSLEPVSSENLIFSSAGLNLKLNFNHRVK